MLQVEIEHGSFRHQRSIELAREPSMICRMCGLQVAFVPAVPWPSPREEKTKTMNVTWMALRVVLPNETMQ